MSTIITDVCAIVIAAVAAPERRSVLIVGSEATPYAKTGGLADVLGALPSAIARLGWDVTLALPRYRGIEAGDLAFRAPVTVGAQTLNAGFYEDPLPDGGRALLIDAPELYDRDQLYNVNNVDYPDNARRFAFVVRAALQWVVRRGSRLSVVHAHDWQAGLAPVYLKAHYANHPVLGQTASVFTIHNLAYQGLFEADWLPRLDLPWSLLAMDRLEFWGRISFLKGGISEATLVTTVSRTYAREIQTPQFGAGLDGILQRRAVDLVGITNGIDTAVWDPGHDPHISVPYGADNLSGKLDAKRAVLERYGLPLNQTVLNRPLIGMISRMVDQKGLDLIAANESALPQLEASFVVLGTGDAVYEGMWQRLAAQYPDRIGVHVGFDEELAHLIEAGADAFLMPSRYEPCGLNQMYSQRYGTVPIVRSVGGLADTVVDYEPGNSGGTGIVFHDYSKEALLEALNRAIALFEDKPNWRTLQLAGMKQDFSWDRSAREYVRVYDRAIGQATVTAPVAP